MNAVERVALSRARLRAAMVPPPALPAQESAAGALVWLERLRHQPAIALVVDTLQNWWARHPLRALVHVAGEATNAVAKPIARRNPLALVVVAGLLGAVLAWSRPWRWAIKPALFAGLLPQLVTRVVAHLPLESWLAVFGSTLSGARAPADTLRSSP